MDAAHDLATVPEAMVVDDSKAMRMILSRILAGLGFQVHQASDGAEALTRLDEAPTIRLALVDWNMPGMDGLSFVKAVRSAGVHRDLRIMMVTSESDPDHLAKALEAGADEYAMKPFDAAVIHDKLELMGLGEVLA